MRDHTAALAILRALSQRAGDGYLLAKRTGLALPALVGEVRELQAQGLVQAEGVVSEQGIGEAYLFVPPLAKGCCGRLLAQQGGGAR